LISDNSFSNAGSMDEYMCVFGYLVVS